MFCFGRISWILNSSAISLIVVTTHGMDCRLTGLKLSFEYSFIGLIAVRLRGPFQSIFVWSVSTNASSVGTPVYSGLSGGDPTCDSLIAGLVHPSFSSSIDSVSLI